MVAHIGPIDLNDTGANEDEKKGQILGSSDESDDDGP